MESIRSRAKELRKQPTSAEKILWEYLRDRRLLGLKFRRQHPLGTYIVDFYCPAFRLVVEIDGEIHRYQEVDDQARTDQLEEKGYKVIRFWNFEVEQNLDTVINQEQLQKCYLQFTQDFKTDFEVIKGLFIKISKHQYLYNRYLRHKLP